MISKFELRASIELCSHFLLALFLLTAGIGTTIKGKFKVLLTDACHTGAITPETDPTAVNHLLKDLGQSIFSLTASHDREQSYEGA